MAYWLVSKYRLNKQEQEQAKLGKEQPAAHCFLANILFGNYRLPIKIYYICSHTVDEKMSCGGHSVCGGCGVFLCVGKGGLVGE